MITKAYILTLHLHHTIYSNQLSGMVQVSLQTSVIFSTNLFVLSELSIVCFLSQFQFYNPAHHNDNFSDRTIQPFQNMIRKNKTKTIRKVDGSKTRYAIVDIVKKCRQMWPQLQSQCGYEKLSQPGQQLVKWKSRRLVMQSLIM